MTTFQATLFAGKNRNSDDAAGQRNGKTVTFDSPHHFAQELYELFKNISDYNKKTKLVGPKLAHAVFKDGDQGQAVRGRANALSTQLLFLDGDKLEQPELNGILASLRNSGYSFVWHFSGGDTPNLRSIKVWVPLSRPIDLETEDFKEFYERTARHLMLNRYDSANNDTARWAFLNFPDGVDQTVHVVEGTYLVPTTKPLAAPSNTERPTGRGTSQRISEQLLKMRGLVGDLESLCSALLLYHNHKPLLHIANPTTSDLPAQRTARAKVIDALKNCEMASDRGGANEGLMARIRLVQSKFGLTSDSIAALYDWLEVTRIRSTLRNDPTKTTAEELNRCLTKITEQDQNEQQLAMEERPLSEQEHILVQNSRRDGHKHRYTEEELNDMCTRLKCTRPELASRLVIETEGVSYVLRSHTYHPATSKGGLAFYQRELAAFPKTVVNFDALSPELFTLHHVTSVNAVIYDYDTQTVYADVANNELILPVRRRVLTQGVYNEQVQAWMDLLAGDHKAELRAWAALAAAPSAKGLPALVFVGEAGSGKDSFRKGLARIWGNDGGDFNKTLTDTYNATAYLESPVMAVEEGLRGDDESFQAWKQAILADNRETNKKYGSKALVRGNIRMIMTINEEETYNRFIKTGGHEERKALARRILKVRVAGSLELTAAKTALGLTEGRTQEEYVAIYNTIGQHILWLMSNTPNARAAINAYQKTQQADVAAAVQGSFAADVVQGLIALQKEHRLKDLTGWVDNTSFYVNAYVLKELMKDTNSWPRNWKRDDPLRLGMATLANGASKYKRNPQGIQKKVYALSLIAIENTANSALDYPDTDKLMTELKNLTKIEE
jgi:hypothetical protein